MNKYLLTPDKEPVIIHNAGDLRQVPEEAAAGDPRPWWLGYR